MSGHHRENSVCLCQASRTHPLSLSLTVSYYISLTHWKSETLPHVWCYPKLRERRKATERRRGWVGGWGRAREREIEKEMKVIARKKERERERSRLVTRGNDTPWRFRASLSLPSTIFSESVISPSLSFSLSVSVFVCVAVAVSLSVFLCLCLCLGLSVSLSRSKLILVVHRFISALALCDSISTSASLKTPLKVLSSTNDISQGRGGRRREALWIISIQVVASREGSSSLQTDPYILSNRLSPHQRKRNASHIYPFSLSTGWMGPFHNSLTHLPL